MIFDALIVGGGPAGASAALLLAQAGWLVGLVEKKQFPRRKVCGEFLSASSLPLLEQLGIAEFYLAHCGPEVRQVGLYASETILISDMPSTGSGNFQWGRALGREHLDTILLQKAMSAGVSVWQPVEVKKIEREGNLFQCITNDMKMSAPLLIMANGSWEKPVEPSENKVHELSDLLAFKAHFLNSSLPQNLMSLLAFPGGYGGMVHTDSQRVTLSCCVRRRTVNELRQKHPGIKAGDSVLNYIKASCRGVREVLADADLEGTWLAAGPIQPGIRNCYKDNVFFVGNAAGEAHPIVAEGISMAIQSAWMLSQILIPLKDEISRGNTLDKAGKEYTRQWHDHFVKRIRASVIFSALAMSNPWAISLMMPLFKHCPALLTWGAKLSGKVKRI